MEGHQERGSRLSSEDTKVTKFSLLQSTLLESRWASGGHDISVFFSSGFVSVYCPLQGSGQTTRGTAMAYTTTSIMTPTRGIGSIIKGLASV